MDSSNLREGNRSIMKSSTLFLSVILVLVIVRSVVVESLHRSSDDLEALLVKTIQTSTELERMRVLQVQLLKEALRECKGDSLETVENETINEE